MLLRVPNLNYSIGPSSIFICPFVLGVENDRGRFVAAASHAASFWRHGSMVRGKSTIRSCSYTREEPLQEGTTGGRSSLYPGRTVIMAGTCFRYDPSYAASSFVFLTSLKGQREHDKIVQLQKESIGGLLCCGKKSPFMRFN